MSFEEREQEVKSFVDKAISESGMLAELPEEYDIIGTGEVFKDYGVVCRKAKKYPIELCHNFISNKTDLEKVYTLIKGIDVSSATKIKGISMHNSKYFQTGLQIMKAILDNFKEKQGEIVMKRPTELFSGDFEIPEKCLIADVRNANGADNEFVEKFINGKIKENFYGYSAWNTSANSLGSLICAAKVKFLAKKYNELAFKKLQAVRLLDDWAYQANVRQTLSEPKNPDMKNFEKRISEFLDVELDVEYKYPWNRLFEIEVILK